MSPAGPIKPIKKPKPKKISLVGGNFAWLDGEENLEAGVSLYVCIQEDPAIFDELESGTYTTLSNETIIVTEGVIDEVF